MRNLILEYLGKFPRPNGKVSKVRASYTLSSTIGKKFQRIKPSWCMPDAFIVPDSVLARPGPCSKGNV